MIQRRKLIFYSGVALGAAAGVLVALFMDAIVQGIPGGSWDEAVRHDLKAYLDITAAPGSPLVLTLIGAVMLLFAAMGGALGCILGGIMVLLFVAPPKG